MFVPWLEKSVSFHKSTVGSAASCEQRSHPASVAREWKGEIRSCADPEGCRGRGPFSPRAVEELNHFHYYIYVWRFTRPNGSDSSHWLLHNVDRCVGHNFDSLSQKYLPGEAVSQFYSAPA